MKFTIFLILTLPCIVFSADPVYECKVIDETICNLENVVTTWKEPGWKPNAAKKYNIETVTIKSGNIPLFTDALCYGLMNAISVTVSGLGIEKLDDFYSLGAFRACDKMKYLDLSQNNLTKVPGSAFRSNDRLEELNLSENPISQLDYDFFTYFYNLKKINLASTLIPYLPFDDEIRKLKQLEIIDLSHTPLLDLEIEKLLFHVPTLKAVYLRDTNILCSRMTEIRNVAGQQGILLERPVDGAQKRERNYEVSYSGTFECLSKEQWNKEIMKGKVGDTLTQTKFETLFEMMQKNDVKTATMDQQISVINQNIDQYYMDTAYVSSYISFIGTTLSILLVIVSITSIIMCCKVRRYIEEERYRNYWRQQQMPLVNQEQQQPYQRPPPYQGVTNIVVDSKDNLYI